MHTGPKYFHCHQKGPLCWLSALIGVFPMTTNVVNREIAGENERSFSGKLLHTPAQFPFAPGFRRFHPTLGETPRGSVQREPGALMWFFLEIGVILLDDVIYLGSRSECARGSLKKIMYLHLQREEHGRNGRPALCSFWGLRLSYDNGRHGDDTRSRPAARSVVGGKRGIECSCGSVNDGL